MKLSVSPELSSSKDSFIPASSQSLLERALGYARQGNYIGAATSFLLLVDELAELPPQIETIIRTLIQSYSAYYQAQQALVEVSRQLLEADRCQQAQIKELEKLFADFALQSRFSQEQPARLVAEAATTPLTSEPPGVPVRLETGAVLPGLYATCFGRFELNRLGQLVALCNNRNGQAVLRYLIIQPKHRETMQVLMSVLWPEDNAETARRKLRVAVSALRRSLNQGFDCPAGEGYILCKNEDYWLNPAVHIQTDVDEFVAHYQAGQQANHKAAAVPYYEAACQLYSGAFLTEDLYSDWSFIRREQLNQLFIAMCRTLTEYYLETSQYEAATRWATRLVNENRCDELAHCQLMQAYSMSGQRSAALKQYHYCRRVLQEELGIEPMPETTSLFYAILKNEI